MAINIFEGQNAERTAAALEMIRNHLEHLGNTGAIAAEVAQQPAVVAVKEEAEAWATGKKNGVPVPSTSPQFNNNAEKFAQQAAQSATDANAAKVAIQDMTVSATTLQPGSSATATKTTNPETGAVNIEYGIPAGTNGQTGATPNISIGTVTTGEPGTDATATITGTPEAPVLNLTIPRGNTGQGADPSAFAPVIMDSTSGAIASFPDGADDLPVENMIVNIVPAQNLNGQSYPYPAGYGKNLFNKNGNDSSKGYANGRYLNSSGGYEYPSSSYQWFVSEYIPVSASTAYTLSGLSASNTPSFCEYDSSKTFVKGTQYATQTTKSFTTDSTTAYIRLSIREDKANTIQLEAGSSATTYAPYENVCPISGRTGTDITIAGKNLFDVDSNSGFVSQYSGITNTKLETGYRVVATTARMVTLDLGVLVSGNYSISWDGINSNGNKPTMYLIKGVDTSISSSQTAIQFTADGVSKYGLQFSASDSVEYYDIKDIQLEFGAKTDFGEYDGNIVQIVFPAFGKNLFDEANAKIYKKYINVSQGRWISSDDSRSYTFKAKPNTEYTIKANDSNVTIFRIGILYKDPDTAVIDEPLYSVQDTNQNKTFTIETGDNECWFIIQGNAALIDSDGIQLQIELGETASAYEVFYNTVLGGYLNVLTGKLTETMQKVTATGAEDENWTYGVLAGKNRVYISPTALSGNAAKISTTNIIFNYAKKGNVAIWDGQISNSGNIMLFIADELDSAAKWKTYLAEHNLEVCYELAEPIVHQLTSQQVATLLGYNNIFADTGDIAVTYRADTKLFIAKMIAAALNA